jgi:predicted PurR-regulated permease PerM
MNHARDVSRRWQLLAITAFIVYLIWLLSPVLMPFAVAAMLAYLGDPLADRLERMGLNRMCQPRSFSWCC